jgi:multiple sugar transport system substrate-binding protein
MSEPSAMSEETIPMTRSVTLTGITWNHTRGYIPVEAIAHRFMDEHPHVTTEWQKRSLEDFGDYPIERLAERFDLLIIDHSFAGDVAATHDTINILYRKSRRHG